MPSLDIIAVNHLERKLPREIQIGNPIFVEENSCYVPTRDFNGKNLSAYHVVRNGQNISSTKVDQDWINENLEMLQVAFQKSS